MVRWRGLRASCKRRKKWYGFMDTGKSLHLVVQQFLVLSTGTALVERHNPCELLKIWGLDGNEICH